MKNKSFNAQAEEKARKGTDSQLLSKPVREHAVINTLGAFSLSKRSRKLLFERDNLAISLLEDACLCHAREWLSGGKLEVVRI